MNCHEAQERILESFERVSAADGDALQAHLGSCAACAEFAAAQDKLEVQLREDFIGPELSPRFADAVKSRITPHAPDMLPAWLPDVAYLGGTAAALAVSAAVLPVATPVVVITGAAVAA